jgi:alpha-glucosidase
MGWWQRSTVYALFPLSFCDSDGDGYGDLEGAFGKLDYLQWLGVDAIWLGPVLKTPLVDVGYDVSDFCDIDPLFGSLATFDRLLAEVHRRGMKMVIDIAPNHTSDQHPWFAESRSSRDNPKRDWFIWRQARPDGGPPNNWVDNMMLPAWEWDEATGQYYYHRFLKCQPDLNFRNPQVVEAMKGVFRFWLDRGVDGFRLDAATHLIEDELLRDEPDGELYGGPPGWMDRLYSSGRLDSVELLMEWRKLFDEYNDRLMLGEAVVPVARLMGYYGTPERPALHFPLNGQLMKLEPWDARRLEASIDQFLMLLPNHGWPSWNLGSHDVSRVATRIGAAQARVAAILLLTLPGTPFIYYGDELGLDNVNVPVHQLYDQYAPYGDGRDDYRTPMPWDDSDGAGFTAGLPWLPLLEDYPKRSVAAQQRDEYSMLHLYRRLLRLRRERPMLYDGQFRPARSQAEVIGYGRRGEGRELLVVLNLGHEAATYRWDGAGEIVVSTGLDRTGPVEGTIDLRGDEGLVIEVTT